MEIAVLGVRLFLLAVFALSACFLAGLQVFAQLPDCPKTAGCKEAGDQRAISVGKRGAQNALVSLWLFLARHQLPG